MKTHTEAVARYIDQPIPVLNHGFIQLVDYMGNDEAIVQAARCSVGKTTKTLSDDQSLIRRLMRDKHTSPFEMVSFKFLCKMPIFVARQWVRHRTAKLNEMSGRYSVLPDEFYIPELERVAYQNPKNKQGRGNVVSSNIAQKFVDRIRGNAEAEFRAYAEFIGSAEEPTDFYEDYEEVVANGGIARELARINLPVGTYTMWMWKIDLHNLFHFLCLRLPMEAQYEIRCYAEAMVPMVKAVCPLAYDAFQDYVLDAITLSGPEIRCLKTLLAFDRVMGEPLNSDQAASDQAAIMNAFRLSKAEHEALMAKLQRLGYEK